MRNACVERFLSFDQHGPHLLERKPLDILAKLTSHFWIRIPEVRFEAVLLVLIIKINNAIHAAAD